MSWLARLFGRADATPVEAAPSAEIEHKGFTIRAEPYKGEGGQYQIAGTILKVVDGETREHGFVRADRLSSLDDATAICLQKGRQIVEEQGDAMFSRRSAKPA